jgi:hypothetical protein
MRTIRVRPKHGLIFTALLSAAVIASATTATSAAAAGQPSGNSASCQTQKSSLARLACLGGSAPASAPKPSAPKKTGPPAGARAVCRDGTYSYSQSRWVACRLHGGVGRWLG